MRACIHSTDYNTPESMARFAEVAAELKMVTGSSVTPNTRLEDSAERDQLKSEQAIAFRAILKKSGRCDSTDSAYSIGKPKDAEAMRKEVCAPCGVRTACAEYALIFNENHGMWGGLTEKARKRIRGRIENDFKLSDLRELRGLPPDAETRSAIRERLSEYLSYEDKLEIAGPGRKKGMSQKPKTSTATV